MNIRPLTSRIGAIARVSGRILSLWVPGVLLLAGCTTTTTTEPGSLASAEALFPSVAVRLEQDTLGRTVRTIGEEIGGGLVSVYGLNERPVPAMNFQGDSYEVMVGRLAEATNSIYVDRDYYYLIYPPGYDLLLGHDLSDTLPARYQGMIATLALGRDTSLYNAFAMLSDSLGITVIADNAVAEAITGEITLDNAPLHAVIEALLQSALVPPQDVVVEATDEYILLSARGNEHPEPLLMNAAELTDAQRATLNRRIDLTLPQPNSNANGEVISFYVEATTLGQVLGSLASQIGVTVHANEIIRDLPVNYSIMHDVRVETALDLIIRQWLVPSFGYTLEENGIHFRVR